VTNVRNQRLPGRETAQEVHAAEKPGAWKTVLALSAFAVIGYYYVKPAPKPPTLATTYQGSDATLSCTTDNDRGLPAVTLKVNGQVYGVNGIGIEESGQRLPPSPQTKHLIDQGLNLCR